ncbi:hypothetical protein IJT17_00440 [bacterium]|nr:hypothetical protein [bacterium]
MPIDVDKEGGTKDFCPIWGKNHTWDLPAPDRRTWGLVSVKNAANSAMSNLKFYRQSEAGLTYVDRLDMSYSANEVAEKVLPEGTYTVTFETIDPNSENKKTGVWMFENVEVKQGKNKADATTALSSVNAKKYK